MRNLIIVGLGKFRIKILGYNTEKLKSLFYSGDYVIRTGDREIHPLFGRLPDNPGELAYMYIYIYIYSTDQR